MSASMAYRTHERSRCHRATSTQMVYTPILPRPSRTVRRERVLIRSDKQIGAELMTNLKVTAM